MGGNIGKAECNDTNDCLVTSHPTEDAFKLRGRWIEVTVIHAQGTVEGPRDQCPKSGPSVQCSSTRTPTSFRVLLIFLRVLSCNLPSTHTTIVRCDTRCTKSWPIIRVKCYHMMLLSVRMSTATKSSHILNRRRLSWHRMHTIAKQNVQWCMRSKVIQGLAEVRDYFNFSHEALHLTVDIKERILSPNQVTIDRLLTLAAGSLIVALNCELQSDYNPEIIKIIGCEPREVFDVERLILRRLNCELGWPRLIVFLRKMNEVDNGGPRLTNPAHFLLEVMLTYGRTIGRFSNR